MFREIEEKDRKGLLKLYMQLHDNEMPEESEQLTELWNNIINDKNHHIIVAEEEGEIVCSCIIIIIPNFTHNQQPYGSYRKCYNRYSF